MALIKIPTIKGVIDRRVLVNFTVDPDIVRKIIPPPFSPVVFKGKAIVGICLIRLKHIRPKGFPQFLGISSENGAHRIAVNWMEKGKEKEGVFIPRRDTSSLANSLAGGRIFPGLHHHAKFETKEENGAYAISFKSKDGTSLSIRGFVTDRMSENSIFQDIDEASAFFQKGETGFSPNGKNFDGLRLKTFTWKVTPLQVNHVQSSFFENERLFPTGSVCFDNALLMTGINHEWHSAGQMNACM